MRDALEDRIKDGYGVFMHVTLATVANCRKGHLPSREGLHPDMAGWLRQEGLRHLIECLGVDREGLTAMIVQDEVSMYEPKQMFWGTEPPR